MKPWILLAYLLLAAAGCSSKPAWEALPLGTKADFRSIWFADATHGWISGGSFEITGGLVGRTLDGGKTWQFVSNLTERDRMSVESIHFVDTESGLAATSSGAILATTDAGASWMPVSMQGRVSGLSSMFFLDEGHGWAAGTGDVIRTDDGGETWTTAELPPGDGEDRNYRSLIRAIHFLDDQNGWIAGMHLLLARSTDGGATWLPISIPSTGNERPNFWDLTFIDSEFGWVVGEEGLMFSTTDGGETWTPRSTGLKDAHSAPKLETIPHPGGPVTIDAGDRTPGFTISAVRFVDRKRGWVTGFYANLGRSLILRTEDGGGTWRVEADIAGEELRTLFIQGQDTAWAVGDRVREGVQSIYRRSLAK